MCNCISCLGAPWSPVECSAYVGTERVYATERNRAILAETGRNFEATSLLTDYT